MTVFCKDCKHVDKADNRTVCKANSDIVDYVTGKKKYHPAAICRTDSTKCGINGSKFEYAGIFGKSCKNCKHYHNHANYCSAVYITKQLPVEEAIEKYCSTGLKRHERNIWLTIVNAI